jgi:colanic acid biosynthesis glycosyl transferase WcaI
MPRRGERFSLYNLAVRILILNLYYPPDTSATAKMAQAVVAELSTGHDVTVLCGRPSYDPTERRAWRPWRSERCERVRIIRVGSTDYSRRRMEWRVVNYLSYVALSVPRAVFVPCDLVLAMTDPPFEGIVGAFVALLKGKPYVYNIRDLYPDMAVGGSIIEAGRMARFWEVLHRWAMRRASRVVALGEDMRRRIIAKGVEGSRVVVIRDGAEVLRPGMAPPEIDAEVVRAIRRDFAFVLVHAGNLGFYGAWTTLIAAARRLENDGIGIVFVGDGAQRAEIETAAAGCRNVHFLSFFPASKIPSVLVAGDAHIITIRRGLEGVVVPSKMYGILAAGRPIVAVAPAESDAASLTTQIGCGVAADPDRAEDVAAKILALSAEPMRARAMGEAARVAANGYDRVSELRKFSQIVEEAARVKAGEVSAGLGTKDGS